MATKNYTESFNIERSTSAMTFTKADGTIVKMTYAEYTAMKKKQARKESAEKKAKKTTTLIEMSKEQAIKLIKGIKVIKSLCAYYDNAYSQWGVIAKQNVIDNPIISASFVRLRLKCRELDKQIECINKESKRSKDTYQLIEKMSYLVDDISKEMNGLVKGINDSRVCEFFKDKEFINGRGRRLGLEILCERTLVALLEMHNVFVEINTISVQGADISDYNPNGSFTRL